MDDWWDLIDHAAALKEQFPTVEQVRAERPNGPLARRADAAHQERARERQLARERAQRVVEERAWQAAEDRWRRERAKKWPVGNQGSSVSGGSFVLEEGMK